MSESTTVIIIREDSNRVESFSSVDIWLTNIAIFVFLAVILLFAAMFSAVAHHASLFETIFGWFYHLVY